ncbi:MAG: sialate O-acetylesterase [Verrucomicrobia bacterium]|nr:sialate O-acetylesterase [Verrucomicrobiota bacterium]
MSRIRTGWALGLLLALAAAPGTRADVTLHGLFTDNMVLQQGVAIPVWGWASPGEEVQVGFDGSLITVTCPASGQWRVTFKARKAGGPKSLIAQGNNFVILTNILIGEVWIASGQSNMQWPLQRAFEPEAAIANSAHPQIRLYTVPRLKADAPQTNVNAAWQLCGPETVPGFSAVAYYFARDLQRALKVPVGIIHSSWGGSPAEVWTSEPALAANPAYRRDILEAHRAVYVKYLEATVRWQKDKLDAQQNGVPFSRRAPSVPWKPGELYNGMIAPLIPYSIRGAIWYQGESNASRAWQYCDLLSDMIRNWRRDWGLGDFTFLQVQLAPYTDILPQPSESHWAELREAQWRVAQTLPNVGLAVITDVGEEKDIHPRRKEPVGARLALAARRIAYGQDVVASGPAFKKMRIKNYQVFLTFDHVGGGLVARDGELKGFAICGKDRKFVWAQARIQGRQVVVSSPQVSKPVAVRYGWASFPVVNLWNKEGLPAIPFRTDDFPTLSAPKPGGTRK